MDLDSFLEALDKRPDAKTWNFIQVKDGMGAMKCSLISKNGRETIIGKSWKEVSQQLNK